MDGLFETIEDESGVVPFQVPPDSDEFFQQMFVLVDRIYPQYSRFVKGYKAPIDEDEKHFTGWQEAARKDIERAFGNLQCRWQWIARPIMLHDLQDISGRVGTCLILHNMCVSDRVMDGDVRARYNPAFQVMEELEVIVQPPDLQDVQRNGRDPDKNPTAIGVQNIPDYKLMAMLRKERWTTLSDVDEHARLHTALKGYHHAIALARRTQAAAANK